MAFAPHLALRVVVLVSMMACICFPIVGSVWFSFLVVVGCIGSICGGRLCVRVVGGLCGNNSWACARASLISFGMALNFYLNSLGDRICWVVGFWIWLRVVILYM